MGTLLAHIVRPAFRDRLATTATAAPRGGDHLPGVPREVLLASPDRTEPLQKCRSRQLLLLGRGPCLQGSLLLPVFRDGDFTPSTCSSILES